MPTFYILVFLILVYYGHVAHSVNDVENPKVKNSKHHWVHKLKYKVGDWRPHFGYHPAHMASDHEYRSRYHKVENVSSSNKRMGSFLDVPLDHYVVRLMDKADQFCNGIIVNQQHVLTTSLCVLSVPQNDIVVKLYDGSRFNVIGHTEGKGFADTTGIKLLTLLKLDRELDKLFERAPSICSHRLPIGESVQLLEWNSRRTYLKKRRVNQVNDDTCKIAINDPKMLVLNNSTSCVSNTYWTKTCQLNMGLPYIHNQTFCGLNLLGHNCPTESSADVFVRLLDEKRYISERLNKIRKFRLDDDIF